MKLRYMTETQFDEKIREMLSEPQEQLPEGLWEGIESRLEAAATRQRRRGTVLVRRWIAGVGAVAAAVAAGLVVAHFVPSGRVEGSEVLAENTAVEMSADKFAEETAVNAEREDAGEASAGTKKEVRFDVIKKKDAGLVAMAVVPVTVPAAEKETKAKEVAKTPVLASEETEGEERKDGTREDDAAKSLPEDKDATVRVDVDADGGEPECELKVDNSDIEAAYGKEEDGNDGSYRGTPFGISVGGNSFGGPQKNSGPRRMFSKGNKTPTGKEFVEGSNSDSYNLPLSFGVGVKYSITKWLGIGVGLNYTLLNKKVTGTYYDEHGWSCSTDMKNSQHYIGIPLDIYFSVFRTRRWDAYATVGGSVEKCILNRYTGTFEGESLLYTRKVGGVQTSVKVGLGVEFSPLEFLGIYIDPSLRYYFDNKQPRSIRTEQPLAFGVEAGLRFKL